MAISRELVGLVKEYLGRGPTHTRTYIRDNLVVCVMKETMTKAEHHVAAHHGAAPVRNARRLVQDSLRDDAIAVIEGMIDRQVTSFMSDHDVQDDYVVLVFVLEPRDGDGDSHVGRNPESPGPARN